MPVIDKYGNIGYGAFESKIDHQWMGISREQSMPSHTVKGQPPEAGQLTKYVTLAGVKFSKAKINSVGEASPDGEYFNVEVTWVPPGLSPVTETHVYWKELGWVRGDPQGPPWPG